MKIAIHTLIGHYNYGCILQAYALQSTLEKLGHSVKIINRRERNPVKREVFKRFLGCIRDYVWRYVLNNKTVFVRNPFDSTYSFGYIDFSLLKKFTQRSLNYTELFKSSCSLSKYANKHKFDAYIVGSDQVWREEYVPNILDSFLGYLPNEDNVIRISYAASFGIGQLPISKDNLPECIKLAKRFRAISVREKSAIKLVNKHFGLDAVHVLDPTLLLDARDYFSIIKDNVFGCKKVVTYILDATEEKRDIISWVSFELKIGMLNLMDYPHNSDGICQPYSIENWLAAISNAEFVVTDSFHGCVFSIIFNKPFVVVANKNRGIERFLSILELLGLEDRLVFSYSEIKENFKGCLCAPVNDGVLAKLSQAKEQSVGFLLEHLK